MAETNIFYKQKKLYNPHSDKQPTIHVYGCGSIGSHTAMALAKTGFNNIILYDYDIVEADNLPAQFYDMHSIQQTEKRKTHQLARIINEFTNEAPMIQSVKIDESFEPEITEDSIHVIAFDNIETRKIMYKKLKNFPIWLIDGRIGGFQYEAYTIRCNKNTDQYKQSLNGEYAETECGEKCLWAVNSQLASVITSNILQIIKEQTPPYKIVKNILSWPQITRLEQ